MLAGAVGPRDPDDAGNELLNGLPVAPTAAVAGLQASASAGNNDGASDSASDSDWQSDTGIDAAGGAAGVNGPALAGCGTLPGPDVVATPRYRDVFGSMPVHDSVFDTFCRAAQLGGALFYDNVAYTAALTEAEVQSMEAAANALGVDNIQTLYGLVNTSKLHRVVQHLGDELRARGNLWEGENSENKRLHSSYKRMFHRSNKRGPSVTLQMIRCDEAQSAVLQDVRDADEESGGTAGDNLDLGGADNGGRGGAGAGSSTGDAPAQTSDLPFTGGARRVPVSALRRSPALARIEAALGVENAAWVTTHKTVRIVARFGWGAPSAVQHLRAIRDFGGKPWYSFAQYETENGGIGWGRLRLVLRSVGPRRRSCVVLQRLRRATPRPGCVLSRHNCVRLRWDLDDEVDEHPSLEIVDARRLLRAEDVQVEYEDLADRLGLRATPSSMPDTVTERRACRFFTNPFFPWTTRPMRPGL